LSTLAAGTGMLEARGGEDARGLTNDGTGEPASVLLVGVDLHAPTSAVGTATKVTILLANDLMGGGCSNNPAARVAR